MSPSRALAVPRRPPWAVVYTLAAAAVFVLPYAIPFTPTANSDSNWYGFNNRAAIAAILATFVVVTLLKLVERQEQAPRENTRSPLSRIALWLILALNTGFLLLVWWAKRGVVGTRVPIGEYFVNRFLCARAGLVPYRDFEFDYGPAMVYLPAAIHRTLGISAASAYLLSLWIFCTVGAILLWWLLEKSQADGRMKTVAFVCLALQPAINFSLTLQYTLLRFIAGFAALVLAETIARRFARHWLAASAAHLVLTLAVFLIAIEAGLAFIAALLVLLIVDAVKGARPQRLTLACYAGGLAALALAAPRDTFLAVRGFAAGSNALPVMPSPFVLLYVLPLITLIPSISADAARWLFGGREFSASPYSPALICAFITLTVAMMPAALTRADFGHVFFNGVGVYILTILTGWKSPRLRLMYAAMLLAISILHPHLPGGELVDEVDSLREDIVLQLGHNEQAVMDVADLAATSPDTWYPALAQYGLICAPLGDPLVTETLWRHRQFQPNYYYAYPAYASLAEVRREVADLETCRYAIYTPHPHTNQIADVEEFPEIEEFRRFLLFPWMPPPHNPRLADGVHAVGPPEVSGIVGRLLADEFVPVRVLNQEFTLFARRPDAKTNRR